MNFDLFYDMEKRFLHSCLYGYYDGFEGRFYPYCVQALILQRFDWLLGSASYNSLNGSYTTLTHMYILKSDSDKSFPRAWGANTEKMECLKFQYRSDAISFKLLMPDGRIGWTEPTALSQRKTQ